MTVQTAGTRTGLLVTLNKDLLSEKAGPEGPPRASDLFPEWQSVRGLKACRSESKIAVLYCFLLFQPLFARSVMALNAAINEGQAAPVTGGDMRR